MFQGAHQFQAGLLNFLRKPIARLQIVFGKSLSVDSVIRRSAYLRKFIDVLSQSIEVDFEFGCYSHNFFQIINSP